MMTTVSAWRCKCGASIKVLGESDLDHLRGRIIVACPKCGTQLLMHLDKIISIETAERDHPASAESGI
jgi:hypothetical protein